MIKLAAAVTTADRVRFVNPYDDAIDYDATDVAYFEDFDPNKLKLVEGKTPTYFILRPCTQAEVRRASAAVAAHMPELAGRVGAVGAELLQHGLVGAENLARVGDAHRWAGGCPPGLLDNGHDLDGAQVVIPVPVQEQLALALYRLSHGPRPTGGLDDEGKSRSPSSSTEAGGSTRSGSSAKGAAKKTK